MSDSDRSASAPWTARTELCGRPIERSLASDQTWLVAGDGDRRLVLKRLDTDCLSGGSLHPNIRERLSRIRELAHPGVANLHGVARDGGDAFLIWEYVVGRTFDRYVGDPDCGERDLLVLARELILSVDALHMQGIVHGALISGNVIIGPDRSVRLTHVSPLLYSDVQVDVESVIALLTDALDRRERLDSPLGALLRRARTEPTDLRRLGAGIAAILEGRDAAAEPPVGAEERRLRFTATLLAALTALAAALIGAGVWRAFRG